MDEELGEESQAKNVMSIPSLQIVLEHTLSMARPLNPLARCFHLCVSLGISYVLHQFSYALTCALLVLLFLVTVGLLSSGLSIRLGSRLIFLFVWSF